MTTIIKLGGSLLDLPNLGQRLLTRRRELPGQVVIVCGGGAPADQVRYWQSLHHLDEPTCHWLAIRCMTHNAHLVSALTAWPVVAELPGAGQTVILDAYAYLQANKDLTLPQDWSVSSDSIALWLALRAGGDLVLLKSVDLAPGTTWEQAAQTGLVDGYFPILSKESRVAIGWVNLRHEPAGLKPSAD